VAHLKGRAEESVPTRVSSVDRPFLYVVRTPRRAAGVQSTYRAARKPSLKRVPSSSFRMLQAATSRKNPPGSVREVGDGTSHANPAALVTKAGTRLTPGVEAGLLAEAERGYDANKLVPRKPGRPPLSDRQGSARRISVRLEDSVYDRLAEAARDTGRRPSELLRDALQRWFETVGR
jgi:hypothetical protein